MVNGTQHAQGGQMATKAFLSTGGGQLREASTFCDTWPQHEVYASAAHAEREASRIIEHTEGRKQDGAMQPRTRYRYNNHSMAPAEREILALALTFFASLESL